jgi:hypothetical protein
MPSSVQRRRAYRPSGYQPLAESDNDLVGKTISQFCFEGSVVEQIDID